MWSILESSSVCQYNNHSRNPSLWSRNAKRLSTSVVRTELTLSHPSGHMNVRVGWTSLPLLAAPPNHTRLQAKRRPVLGLSSYTVERPRWNSYWLKTAPIYKTVWSTHILLLHFSYPDSQNEAVQICKRPHLIKSHGNSHSNITWW